MGLNKLAIIQARMSSTRLLGKVMSEISQRPLLQYMLERVKRSKMIDDLVLATTTDPSDDILEQLWFGLNLPCYRGSLHDVLDRYYQAARQYRADVIIRLTADCPLIDPGVIDQTVSVFLGEPMLKQPGDLVEMPNPYSVNAFPADFATNRLPPPWKRTLPIGLDVEVCTFNSLERAWQEAREQYQREHVMPYLYEGISFPEQSCSPEPGWYIEQGTSPRGFKVVLLNHKPDYGSLRWTVDTLEDLEFVRRVADRFEGRTNFGWLEVLALLEREPELAGINQGVKHKSAYDVDQRSQDP